MHIHTRPNAPKGSYKNGSGDVIPKAELEQVTQTLELLYTPTYTHTPAYSIE